MSTTPITETIRARSGSHILYFYANSEAYLKHAASYIHHGLRLGEHVLFVDSPKHFQRIQERLALAQDLSKQDLERIHFVSDYQCYGRDCDFNFHYVFANFEDLVGPLARKGLPMRTWGRVTWREQKDIDNRLAVFEGTCDLTLAGLGYTTVCAYDGHCVPAYIQTEMMRHHEYFMTDDSLSRSNLYKESLNHAVNLPSSFLETGIQPQADLSENKLNFLNVLAHEVRNPLTVIEANAVLLEEQEHNEEHRKILEAIVDYAKVVHYEINHFIETERILSRDLLWQKRLIRPLPVMLSVLDMAKLKAQTQHMRLLHEFELDGTETVFANEDGLHLLLLNILNYMIEFGRKGQDILFTVRKTKGPMVVQLQENSIGLTNAQLGELYETAKRADGERFTSERGLYLSSQIVHHFNGQLTVENHDTRASTFHIEIPLSGRKH